MKYNTALKLLKQGKSVYKADWGDYKYLLMDSDKTIYLYKHSYKGKLIKSVYSPSTLDLLTTNWKQSYFNRNIE